MEIIHWRKQNEIFVMTGIVNDFDFRNALQKWRMLSFIHFTFFRGLKIQISPVKRKSTGETCGAHTQRGERKRVWGGAEAGEILKIDSDEKAYFGSFARIFILLCI